MAPLFYYGLLVFAGILPSLLWLFYFLKNDPHPEPRYLIAKTFLMGIIISPLAIILEVIFIRLFLIQQGAASFFLWGAFVEEFVKFFAVLIIVFRSPEFDEPVDAMIYMITAALGFAAMENILFLFQQVPNGVHATATLWFLRFFGATLLHALASAFLGYFIALAWFFHHHAKKFILVGLAFATFFHFAFNLSLSSFEDNLQGLSTASLLLITVAFLVKTLFDKIKERRMSETATLT